MPRSSTISDSRAADSTTPPTLAELPLDEAILSVLARAERSTLGAPEIANIIAKTNNETGDWHALLAPIRKAAIALAQSGRLIIYRHGKPADPAELRGVYRLGLPRQD